MLALEELHAHGHDGMSLLDGEGMAMFDEFGRPYLLGSGGIGSEASSDTHREDPEESDLELL